jgi:hypothetical protein
MTMCRVNLADFIFAKEYRGRESYSEKACVAALEIANKYAGSQPRTGIFHQSLYSDCLASIQEPSPGFASVYHMS